MLLGGDEIGRTQHGNNNAWCQDNEISWYHWDLDEEREELLEFARRLIRFRAAHPVFRRSRFLEGRPVGDSPLPDAWWFRPDGRRMTRRDWLQQDGHRLGMFLNGDAINDFTPQGEPIVDDSFLLLFNAFHEPVVFTLPPPRFGRRWETELSTAEPLVAGEVVPARGLVPLEARSVVVLRRVR
jgi:glycogen operon protein